MNAVMYDGKKSVAETSSTAPSTTIEAKPSQDPLGVFHQALDNVAPAIEVRSRRVGGATYQVPVEVRPSAAGSGHPLAHHRRAQPQREDHVERLSGELWTPPTTAAPPSRSAKTRTRWPKPTAPSRTTAGNV
jgi:small subunit ribosomal protein S7